MTRIKVLHLLSSLNVGGREKVAIDIVNSLDRERFVPVLMSLRPGGSMRERVNDDVEVITYNKSDKLDFNAYREISNVIRKKNIDVLHTHNPGAFLYGFIGGKLGGLKKIINTEHGFEYNLNLKKRIAERICRRFIALTIAVSDDVKKRLGSSGEIRVLHNGIIISDSDYSGERENQRRMLGILPDDIVVGCVARLAYVKNHKCLLRAFRIAAEKENKLKLIIVGDGYLKEHLLALRGELSLEDKVIFYGETNNVCKVLHSMDIFALTSVYEGVSITILEAMSCGLPVVATRVGGNPDVIEDGKSGILVKSEDAESAADAILKLAVSEQMRKNFGACGHKIVKEKFNFIKTIKDIQDIYITL